MKKRIFISGQEGMVGSAVYRRLKNNPKFTIIDCLRKDLDLTNQESVNKWFILNKPDIVINAAGKVGGILDNSLFKDEYLYENALIGLNILKASFSSNVKQLINLGSACIYPKNAVQPIKEDYLLSDKLESTNEGYALAKILVLKYAQYIKEKYKKNYITLMPANLYGPGDNFNLQSSHVIPALIKKFHLAKIKKLKKVEVWGSGNQEREFLHVDDLASAIVFCLNKKINISYVNVAGADVLKIKNLCEVIKKTVGYNCEIVFNKKFPDGVLKRSLFSKNLKKLGWEAKIKLNSKIGIKSYYDYFKKNI